MDDGGYDWLLFMKLPEKLLGDKKGKSQPFMLRHLCCVPIQGLQPLEDLALTDRIGWLLQRLQSLGPLYTREDRTERY